MWSYYGSKSKVVHLYPRPECGKIIEPFAGSARYALRYFDRGVLLVDKYEVVVRIWKWLQQCSPQDVLNLPAPQRGERIRREDFDCDEAFWLVGFIVARGNARPMLTAQQFNNVAADTKRIARNLWKIKHWQIQQGDYRDIPNQEATWFIDPPYQVGKGREGGSRYVFSNRDLDYMPLAQWAKGRAGQVIVCESNKADWLPFLRLSAMNGLHHVTTEAIWTNRPTHYEIQQMPLELAY